MHALDFTTGKAGVAYVGETPWHKLGQPLTPGAPLEVWQSEAGLDWEAREAGVAYQRKLIDAEGKEAMEARNAPRHKVLYRSDTGDVLSIMGKDYKPVQPKQVIEFYRDLTEKYGYQLETAGSLMDGRRIWALANTDAVTQLRGNDTVRGYLLLATSFDGTMSTQARFTAIRVVCNNTLQWAAGNSKTADVVIPHCSMFDADAVKEELKIGDAWEALKGKMQGMTERVVSRDETVKLYLAAYFGLTTPEKIEEFRKEEGNDKRAEKLIERLTEALFNSPGATLASARGTLWGALNAVTYDVDHTLPSRSDATRFNKAQFGEGNLIKQRAFRQAEALLAA